MSPRTLTTSATCSKLHRSTKEKHIRITLANPYSILLVVTMFSLVRATWIERWDEEIGKPSDAGGESESLVESESGGGWTPSVS
jgi:hypothetical protein